MAQYFDDFTKNELGSSGIGWTTRWGSLGRSVISDVGATGGVALQIGPGSAVISQSFLSMDAVDNDPNRQDFEILIRSKANAQHSTGINLCGAAGRVSNSGGFTGYSCGRRFTSYGVRSITQYTAETATYNTASGTGVSNQVYAYGRFSVNGTSLKYRSWGGILSDEPATWEVNITDSTHTEAGWIGIWRSLLTDNVVVDFIGIGTGGDPAPSSPVTSLWSRTGSFQIQSTGWLKKIYGATIAKIFGVSTSSVNKIDDV